MNKFGLQMQNGTGAGGRFVQRLRDVAAVVSDVRAQIDRWVSRNRASLRELGRAFDNLAAAARSLSPIVRRVASEIIAHFQRIARVVTDVIGVVVALINGDWSKAWRRARNAVRDAFAAMAGDIKAVGGSVLSAAKAIGGLAVRGIIAGMGSLGHAILGKVKDAAGFVGKAIGKLNPFGDGVGKALGNAAGDGVGILSPKVPGGGLPSLMGAQAALAPVASVGSRFGLQVSSGRRPGAITSSGNVSYHSSGEAIDEAGSPSGMMGFFRYMKSNFGPRLAELIYTPGGAGIKNGRPFTYTGAVAADHFDHVHVALDTGRPGVGDGSGMTAADAARRAGFSGQALVTALAIADAESGFNPAAQNLKYPDHSIGLWQINQLAHRGRYGSDSALMNPLANARAAYAISGGGRNWGAWSTYSSGAYKGYLSVAQQLARSVTSSGRSISGGSSAPAAAGRSLSDSGLKSTLTGSQTSPNYKAGITSAFANLLSGRATAAASAWHPDPVDAPSAIDVYNERIGRINLAERAGVYTPEQAKADRMYQANSFLGGGYGDVSETDRWQVMGDLREFSDAVTDNTDAIKAQTDALNSLRDEVKRQNDYATSVAGITAKEAVRAMADVISGQIFGYGYSGRAMTAGAGSVVRY
jgi:hypothetical protein